jgi:hypothetical protein
VRLQQAFDAEAGASQSLRDPQNDRNHSNKPRKPSPKNSKRFRATR